MTLCLAASLTLSCERWISQQTHFFKRKSDVASLEQSAAAQLESGVDGATDVAVYFCEAVVSMWYMVSLFLHRPPHLMRLKQLQSCVVTCSGLDVHKRVCRTGRVTCGNGAGGPRQTPRAARGFSPKGTDKGTQTEAAVHRPPYLDQ